ncbi:MAG: NAD-dependent epimerase/dehydratase family protein [Planctomycetota bacterium]|nr:MAG: NAD-dependent epimerase/dehydratase family protein [Planctomycetota bacterium]
MRILMTGATGFVGTTTVPMLLEAGHQLRLLLRQPDRLAKSWRDHPQVEWVQGAMDRPESLDGICRGVDAVLHVAGVLCPKRSREFLPVNVEGTRHLAQDCRQQAPKARFVLISSLAASGPGRPRRDQDPAQPVSAYGHSKLAGEQALAAAGLEDWVVLRPPAVYGPGDDGFLPYFQSAASGMPMLIPAGGTAHLSMIHVRDLAAAMKAALECPRPLAGPRLHVCHPEEVGLESLLAGIAAAVGRPCRTLPVPFPVVRALAGLVSPWRLLTGKPKYLSLDKVRELRQPAWCCDPSGAAKLLGWKAEIDVESGLLETARAYVQMGALKLRGEAPWSQAAANS